MWFYHLGQQTSWATSPHHWHKEEFLTAKVDEQICYLPNSGRIQRYPLYDTHHRRLHIFFCRAGKIFTDMLIYCVQSFKESLSLQELLDYLSMWKSKYPACGRTATCETESSINEVAVSVCPRVGTEDLSITSIKASKKPPESSWDWRISTLG